MILLATLKSFMSNSLLNDSFQSINLEHIFYYIWTVINVA